MCIEQSSLSFATDTNNPLETGYTFANSMFGNFTSVSQANRNVQSSTIMKSTEWFVQDSWKATRRLTFEIGVRFINATVSDRKVLKDFVDARLAEQQAARLAQANSAPASTPSPEPEPAPAPVPTQ